MLWVLLWHANGSRSSTLLRVDANTGAVQRSGLLGAWAVDVAVGHGHVWIARKRSLTVVDPASLEKQADIALADDAWQVLSDPAGVYVGTRTGVVRIAPSTMKVTHRIRLGERVSGLAMHGDALAAITEKGTIHLLDARTLTPRVTLASKASEPRAMVAHGDALFVTKHEGNRAGSVLVFRPTGEQPWR